MSRSVIPEKCTCHPYTILSRVRKQPSPCSFLLTRIMYYNLLSFPCSCVFPCMAPLTQPEAIKLFQLFMGVVIVSHTVGTLFFGVANYFPDNQQCASEDKTVAYRSLMKNYSFTNYSACKWDHTWIEKQFAEDLLPADKDNGMWAFYVRCINWALPTLVVVVIGDVVPVNGGETLYAFICMLVGMVINAMIIGNIANIVAGSDSPAVRLKKRIYALNKFMRGQQLPETARNRVHKFFQESVHINGGINDASVVADLPVTLQTEVFVHERLGALENCNFFDGLDEFLLKSLACSLRPETFVEGDILIRQGLIVQNMAFIHKVLTGVHGRSSDLRGYRLLCRGNFHVPALATRIRIAVQFEFAAADTPIFPFFF